MGNIMSILCLVHQNRNIVRTYFCFFIGTHVPIVSFECFFTDHFLCREYCCSKQVVCKYIVVHMCGYFVHN